MWWGRGTVWTSHFFSTMHHTASKHADMHMKGEIMSKVHSCLYKYFGKLAHHLYLYRPIPP